MARILPLAVPLFLMACAGDQGVKAFNAEPEAEITSHSDADEVLEGYTESFRGAVSDPDHAAEAVTVDAGALVALGDVGQGVRGLEPEGLADLHQTAPIR